MRRPRTLDALLALACLLPAARGAEPTPSGGLAQPALPIAPAAATVATPIDPVLRAGDRVVLVGSALAERMQHHGWLETRLQERLPELALSFRNLGFSADTLDVQQRTAGFGSWQQWLDRTDADVVFGFFGYVDSFAGEAGLPAFRERLAQFIADVTEDTGERRLPRRLVLVSPVPFERTGDALLPDPIAENARIGAYARAMAEVAAATRTPFIDLFVPMQARQEAASAPLTIDGVHLTEAGDDQVGQVIERALCGPRESQEPAPEKLEAIRAAVLEKNRLWFNRYRATDGYNVYGGRSSLTYDGVTNFDVLQRELEHLDALCDWHDTRIGALAAGRPEPAPPTDLPPLIPVATNRPGPLPGGKYAFRSGEEAIDAMTPAPGFRVELFADEQRFPEIANPVQMAFDTRGDLWIAAWPTYPHWKPGEAMDDKLVALHDDDGDGRADRSTVFADDLHNPTGFEFWNGGVLVANAPDLLFLRDTDGDGVADTRERLLHGLSSGDTHHSANSFVLGPDGALYFQEGTFHQSQIESVYGPVRNHDGCSWRYEPRTRRVERYTPYGFANPHGHVFDRWGQDFLTDGTGNVNYYALPFSGFIQHPAKHGGYFPFFQQRSRPAAATEILSSAQFPDANQGNYVIANVIGFQGVFQYAFRDDGSGFGADEVEPLVYSSDPNFRPVDLELGPDGALWLLDWQNPLIGHMQHHLRDPSRDKTHGRIYRIVAEGRPLSVSPEIAGRPVPELVALLAHGENRVRYRARIELSSRDSDEVVAAARAWVAGLDPKDPEHEHQLLEALWLQEQHATLDRPLLLAVLRSPDARARAAATRVLRHLRRLAPDALELLAVQAADPVARVRLEAVVALSEFADARAAEIVLAARRLERDRFLDYAIDETLRALEPHWRAALASGQEFAADDPDGLAFALSRLDNTELAGVRPSVALWREQLSRHGLETGQYLAAARDLARAKGPGTADALLAAIDRADARTGGHVDHLLSGLFEALNVLQAIDADAAADRAAARDPRADAGTPAGAAPGTAPIEALTPDERRRVTATLRIRAMRAQRPATRKLATVARLRADGTVAPAWEQALGSVGSLLDLLDAAPLVDDEALATELLQRVLPLLDGPPPELAAALAEGAGTRGRYVRLELPGDRRTLTLAEVQVFSRGDNVALGGSASQSTTNWSGVASRAIDGNTSGRYGDDGQTHTMEDSPDTWWELDLGAERDLDEVVVWNRSESDGQWIARLDGYVLSVLDGERRTVFSTTAGKATAEPAHHVLAAPLLRLRREAARCLAGLGVAVPEVLATLVARWPDEQLRPALVSALNSVPDAQWPDAVAAELAGHLVPLLAAADADSMAGDAGRELLALASRLPAHLFDEEARELRTLVRRLGPQVVSIRPVPDALLYDRKAFTVVAGHPVELRFDNVDIMPHNLVVTAPGALAKVGLGGEAMAASPDAWDRGYVPDLPEVLWATGLIQPGGGATLSFRAPATPGDHPYVCTFPGHWVRMNGVMHVVSSWDALEAAEAAGTLAGGATGDPAHGAAGDASADGAPAEPKRHFVKAWSVKDLTPALAGVANASPARGRTVLEEASCLLCHQIGGQGGLTGPSLDEVVTRHDALGLLTQMIEPSEVILDGYASELVFTKDGRVFCGRVRQEDAQTVGIQADPYSQELTVLRHDEIDERRTSELSAMPEGLLWTWERDDIVALIAYLASLREDG